MTLRTMEPPSDTAAGSEFDFKDADVDARLSGSPGAQFQYALDVYLRALEFGGYRDPATIVAKRKVDQMRVALSVRASVPRAES